MSASPFTAAEVVQITIGVIAMLVAMMGLILAWKQLQTAK